MIRHVVIVGAGFSGTLQAINLLRHDGPRATLIERAVEPGRGVAYGAADPAHLLNVRAANMSAFPDGPDHLVRWLTARGVAEPAAAFIPRLLYGEYLNELLDAARARAQDRLTVLRAEVADIVEEAEGVRVLLADGGTLHADAAVLSVGNLPPHAPPGLDPAALSPDRYRSDPWAPGQADGLSSDDTVLVLGTGLTMVDMVLKLDADGFRGRIVALSRRGLLPRRHQPGAPPASPRDTRPTTTASALVRDVRARARAIGWRQAVDELRPFTQGLWAAASRTERRRFIRHLRPWWDVHRHRIAPVVADRLAALQAEGRLDVRAGRTLRFAERPGGVELVWRPRGGTAEERLSVARILNCTGPQGDLSRTDEPLLRALLARGTIRPDAEHLGLDVEAGCAVIAADGTPSERMFALGPMTRGAFWEIVAVPDIRRQTWDLARRLSNAHWVSGEGL